MIMFIIYNIHVCRYNKLYRNTKKVNLIPINIEVSTIITIHFSNPGNFTNQKESLDQVLSFLNYLLIINNSLLERIAIISGIIV